MNIELRASTESDKEFARLLHHAAYHDVVVCQFGDWNDAVQDKFFDESWNPNETSIIRVDGRDCGAIRRREYADHIEIVEIQLLPSDQGRGIGTTVLDAELAAADRARIPVRLRVLKQNRAQHLYKRLGFQIVGATETHVLMQRSG